MVCVVVMDAGVGAVLFVEFEDFVVFAFGGGPVVDVVFVEDDDGVALGAGDSSADTDTHVCLSIGRGFAYGLGGRVSWWRRLVAMWSWKIWMRPWRARAVA